MTSSLTRVGGEIVFNRHGYSEEGVRFNPTSLGLTEAELDELAKPGVQEFVEEYGCNDAKLRDDFISLETYLRTAMGEGEPAELSPVLQSACKKLQSHFGAVSDRRNPLN